MSKTKTKAEIILELYGVEECYKESQRIVLNTVNEHKVAINTLEGELAAARKNLSGIQKYDRSKRITPDYNSLSDFVMSLEGDLAYNEDGLKAEQGYFDYLTSDDGRDKYVVELEHKLVGAKVTLADLKAFELVERAAKVDNELREIASEHFSEYIQDYTDVKNGNKVIN